MNTSGFLHCPQCEFATYSQAGLRTHEGKAHADDEPDIEAMAEAYQRDEIAAHNTMQVRQHDR